MSDKSSKTTTKEDYDFSFTVGTLENDTFIVHSFTGSEGISELYHFDVYFITKKKDIDCSKLLQNTCKLKLQGQSHSFQVNGIIKTLKFKEYKSGQTLYQAQIVPQLDNLTLQRYCKIFLDKDILQIIKEVLKDQNITHYDIRTSSTYPVLDYVCQFNETHYHFLARWMEHYGIYYYFEQGEESETLVIADSKATHKEFTGSNLIYHTPSGLEDNVRENVIYNFLAEYSSVPKNLFFKDYNYQKPKVSLSAKADVLDSGVGTSYTYGDNFFTTKEGDEIAARRAQGVKCRQVLMHGESLCLSMQAGYTFDLKKHLHEKFNRKYLVLKVQHKAKNNRYLIAGMGNVLAVMEKDSVYSNTFTAIPDTEEQQFRPALVTEKPRYYGLISATIDAEGTGKYAHLDEYGRYKVVMPFDLSGLKEGHASYWVRQATPYAGHNYGLHFPLLKGTEVLVSYVEGDIDRPVILSAIHNFEKVNHVKNTNPEKNSITTASGSQFVMGDKRSKSFINMHVPNRKAGFHLSEIGKGESNDDSGTSGSGDSSDSSGGGDDTSDKSLSLQYSTDHYKISYNQSTEVSLGVTTGVTIGFSNEAFIGGKADVSASFSWGASLGSSLEYSKGDKVSFGGGECNFREDKSSLVDKEFAVRVGPSLPIEQYIKKIYRIFAAMIASSLVTAGTNAVSFAEALKNAKDSTSDGYGCAASACNYGAMGLNAVVGVGACVWLHSILKQIEEANKNAYVRTKFELTKDKGMSVDVDLATPFTTPGVQFSSEAVLMRVGNHIGGQPSDLNSLKIGGNAITLENFGTASIKMDQGKKILLEVVGEKNSSFVRLDDELSLGLGDTGVDLLDREIELYTSHFGARLKMMDTGSTLSAGEATSLSVMNEGISMKSAQIKAEADATLKLNANGMITLG